MDKPLLGYLGTRFATSPENLATEALNYILGRSKIASDAFTRYLGQLGVDLPEDLAFRTQVQGRKAEVPDLVGYDQQGREMLICEAKFWAGLTSNQPQTYLDRLPEEVGALLLFIGPAKRIQTLWPELLTRCKNKELFVEQLASPSGELCAARLPGGRTLALTSWRSILNVMQITLESHGELNVAADVIQLSGLCVQMDESAFFPIQAEELSSGIGQRIIHYHELVDGTVNRLIKEMRVSKKGLRAASSYARYVRYFSIHGFGFGLQFNADYWRKHRETPIWLSVWQIQPDNKWVHSEQMKERLRILDLDYPPRIIKETDCLIIPIYIPVGCEKEGVIRGIQDQIEELIELLSHKTHI